MEGVNAIKVHYTHVIKPITFNNWYMLIAGHCGTSQYLGVWGREHIFQASLGYISNTQAQKKKKLKKKKDIE
jgi:hypothetical protein